jgi:uncharacterized protein YdbL (DUF1318 family)
MNVRHLALLSTMLAGCVTVRPVVLDRKTQLENQILGTFERLEDDLVLASSVRGPDAPPALSPLEREALEAMMTREYQRDDVDALKEKQIVGEAASGYLQLLSRPAAEPEARRVRALVDEENRCRRLILERAIALGQGLSAKDLPEMGRILHRMLVKTARPGERVQDESGAWRSVMAGAAPAEGRKR